MKALWGPCVRRLHDPVAADGRPVLYLTFDDGPDPQGTPETLALLERFGAKATFFVVAEHAAKHPALLRRVHAAGHQIGNHSLDHSWAPFFASRQKLMRWIEESERRIQDMIGEPTVGFRSPAGVQTPPLHWALRELKMPLIHWNIRFYDAVWAWRADVAKASLKSTPSGSIVLLHDRQRPCNQQQFFTTLSTYLASASARFCLINLPAPPQESRR